MAARVQQDTFMEDADDTCPLCVEEFDLSDRGFKPCPCGYQVCQFCYNNIKNNMNGLCPACRRPYDDKSIEWRIISPEEFKADIANQARKKAAARQKEAERRQVETLSKKHLQGLRVVQRNLVYITGMTSEGVPEDQLEEQLRGPSVFGQYGRIIKLAANKIKDSNANSSLAIFITFADQEAASACIAALDGKPHQGRILKAQHGTTKYCQAYLRNDSCNNKNCTFLHETGEDSDSFSRQDLSSLNAASTQRPAPSTSASSSRVQQQAPQAQPPPKQHADPAIAAVVQAAMGASATKADVMSRSNSGDGSALPTTANWAKNPHLQQSRRSSQAASRASPSPKVLPAKPVPRSDSRASRSVAGSSSAEEKRPPPVQDTTLESLQSIPVENPAQSNPTIPTSARPLDPAVKALLEADLTWSLDRSLYDSDTLRIIDNYPLLIDPCGGATRYALRPQPVLDQSKAGEQADLFSALRSADDEDNLLGGSLQLGGEPDTADDDELLARRVSGRQTFSSPPFGDFMSSGQQYSGNSSLMNDFDSTNLMGRSGTPQGPRSASVLKSNHQTTDSGTDQFRGPSSGTASHHQSQLSNPFQSQNQPLSNLSRHARQLSRFSFANDNASTSTSVKPSPSLSMSGQQMNMLTGNQSKPFATSQHQTAQHTNFYSGVQGPPPGLKSTGTPPISGGGMFGQGHGFASAMGGNMGFSGSHSAKSNNEDIMRDLLRGRAGTGAGVASDAGKRESLFPSLLSEHHSPSFPAPGLSNLQQGSQFGSMRNIIEQPTLKQKKKGKKHRHANTSSSGGGGIVDLADPSILQARMHHTGTGQGSYTGTQGQGVYSSHSLPYGGGFGGRW